MRDFSSSWTCRFIQFSPGVEYGTVLQYRDLFSSLEDLSAQCSESVFSWDKFRSVCAWVTDVLAQHTHPPTGYWLLVTATSAPVHFLHSWYSCKLRLTVTLSCRGVSSFNLNCCISYDVGTWPTFIIELKCMFVSRLNKTHSTAISICFKSKYNLHLTSKRSWSTATRMKLSKEMCMLISVYLKKDVTV